MSSRMRKPETTLLQISRGDWLLVKKRLTLGEQQDMFDRMASASGIGLRASMVGVSKVQAYLLDWSITDADDKPVLINNQPEGVVLSALRALDPDDFKEIREAIEAHMAKVEKEDEARRKNLNGEQESSPVSPSVSSSNGPMTTSPDSTLMSIA